MVCCAAGPDWKASYGTQEGTAFSPGVCIDGGLVPSDAFKWVKVMWAANKHSNSYRIGRESDVVPIDPDPRCADAIRAIYEVTGRPVPSELAAKIAAASSPGAAAAASDFGASVPTTVAAAMAAMRDLVARSEEALHTLRADKAELEKDLAAARRGREAAVAEQSRANQTVAALRTRVTEMSGQLAAVLAAAGRLDGATASAPEIAAATAAAADAAPAAVSAAGGGAPSLIRMESTRTRAMGSCVICMDAPAVMCPATCGHVCVCEADAARIRGKVCPICREAVTAMVRVYLVGGD